jgi:hypothetical protein
MMSSKNIGKLVGVLAGVVVMIVGVVWIVVKAINALTLGNMVIGAIIIAAGVLLLILINKYVK